VGTVPGGYAWRMAKPLIYLASASPRRSALLRQIGVAHEVRPVEVDEGWNPAEVPPEYVLRLAREKSEALWNSLDESTRGPVLAADTSVVLDGEVFGKPGSLAEARTMLGRLSGRAHDVYTAVAMVSDRGTETRLSRSAVSFRELSPREIDWYWSTGEPADKAGGYAVQGLGAIFVAHLAGSYSGVMGLPLFETWELISPLLSLNQGGR
jgi:septum formation protein